MTGTIANIIEIGDKGERGKKKVGKLKEESRKGKEESRKGPEEIGALGTEPLSGA